MYMKKNIEIIILLSFLTLTNIKAQELTGRVTYNVSLNLTIEEATKRNNAIGRKISQRSIDRINNARDVLAFLEFNNQHSIQKLETKLNNEGKNIRNKTKSGAGNKKIYYTNNSFLQKNSVVDCETLGECFLIEQPKPVWKITQISKIIGGYLCFKAVYQNKLYKEKKPIAWFTPKVPARYGPKFFSGLPGLILELEDNTVTFTAVKIELNPKEEVKIKKPKGIAITKENYEKLLRKKFPDFYKKWEKYKKSKKS